MLRTLLKVGAVSITSTYSYKFCNVARIIPNTPVSSCSLIVQVRASYVTFELSWLFWYSKLRQTICKNSRRNYFSALKRIFSVRKDWDESTFHLHPAGFGQSRGLFILLFPSCFGMLKVTRVNVFQSRSTFDHLDERKELCNSPIFILLRVKTFRRVLLR